MARRRLAVALLIPQPLATEINGIRRACGDPRLGRIAPHITLAPPVNVAEERVGDVLDACRDAARSTPALHLTLGAPSTFAPVTPLAWLRVGGEVDAVQAVQRRLAVGPLARPAEHAFVAHVTVSAKVDATRLEAILVALDDFAAACTIDRLHVLENQQLADGRWGWVPLTDMAFRRPAVVGTGGLPLELTVGTLIEPDTGALIAMGVVGAARGLTVTARRDGSVVGAAAGTTHDGLAILDALIVAQGHRGQGVGSHLLARFTAEATVRNCSAAVRVAPRTDATSQLCRRRGWTVSASGSADEPLTVMRVLADR